MTRAICVLLVVTACSGSAERGAAVPGATAAPGADAGPTAPPAPGYRLAAGENPPPFTVECQDLGPPPKRRERRLYDLGSIALPTTITAPRSAERPRRSVARTPLAIADVVDDRDAALEACWKWAQAKGTLAATRVTLSFRVDPWGRLVDLDAVSARADDAALLTCIEDMLATATADQLATRWTRATIDLDLTLADQPAWKKLPKRPAAPAARPRGGELCTPVQSDVADDEVAVLVPLQLSDHDDSRIPSTWVRTQRRAPYPSRGPWVPATHEPDERQALQRDLAANLGGFAACHAAARARLPDLEGEVTVRWQHDQGGAPQVISATGAGDGELHECLRAAIGELWFQPWSRATTLEVVQHFAVSAPRTIAAGDPHRQALELLAWHDADGALAAWEALLAADPTDDDSCRWRVGVLRAAIARAPWLDDRRVDAALADLVAHALTIDAGDARACLEIARPSIDLLLGPAVHGDSIEVFDDSWRERLDVLAALLPVSTLLEEGERLPVLHALGISLSDPRQAVDRLRLLGERTGPSAELARTEADRIADELLRIGERAP